MSRHGSLTHASPPHACTCMAAPVHATTRHKQKKHSEEKKNKTSHTPTRHVRSAAEINRESSVRKDGSPASPLSPRMHWGLQRAGRNINVDGTSLRLLQQEKIVVVFFLIWNSLVDFYNFAKINKLTLLFVM